MESSDTRPPGLAFGVLLWALVLLTCFAWVWQAGVPRPWHFAGITVDRLSATMAVLVTGVGAATYRFSRQYLLGEPGQTRFLVWLGVTVAAALVLMLSTHLLLLFAAWSLVSFGLHRLLTYYGDRPEVWPPARKKFLISRIGDAALLAAVAIVRLRFGTFDLHAYLSHAAEPSQAVAVLVAVAALTKSAQFPFHSWLPETMEAPTPVSALMHAGVINAGGLLLLRFAPVVAASPAALLVLVTVGTVTATLGTVAMWAQVKVKRTLAWSTVGQMGFMMIQCGLGAFPAAALHIVGHGFYKAWSFLRAGGLPSGPVATPLPPGRQLGWAAVGTLVAAAALASAFSITGFRPAHAPGELGLTAVLALAIGQLWPAVLRKASPGRVAWTVLLTVTAALLATGLYHGMAVFFAPVLGPIVPPHGPVAWVAAAIPVTALVGLVLLHASLPALAVRPAGRSMRVHALHGFYFGVLADRFVAAVWRALPEKEASHV